MGRSPRIEFEGALYHVMSRGNRQEPVFRDAQDNEMFLDALGEVCGRTGWRVHAFVLMGNHYHLLLETPEANLVDGMRWLQGTYTKRFNIRHKQWGHLFQGRYKALLIDPKGEYFQTVSSYIHLNPARVNGYDFKNSRLSEYVWSSYPLYFQPTRRPEYLAVDRTLGSFGWLDDRPGRERYRRYMQKRVLELAGSERPWDVDEGWSEIRRGWCMGGEDFRHRMIQVLDGVMSGKRRDSYTGDEARRHDLTEAEHLAEVGLDRLGLLSVDLTELKKSDPRKKAVAWLIRKQTCVKNEWICNRLKTGSVTKLSSFVSEVECVAGGELLELKKRVER